MKYKIKNYVKTKENRGFNIHVFDISTLDDVVERQLEIKACPGTKLDKSIGDLTKQNPYFTAEDEDFKKGKITIMIGCLWEYGFAPSPELSFASRRPKLSNKAEIHSIELSKGNFDGKRFKREENNAVEQEVLDRYCLADCSEQDEYNNFLKNKGAAILKQGKNYRIIELPEGQFRISFSF